MDLFENRNASPMLIARQMEAFNDPDYIYELKMDGFRCLAYVDQNSIDLRNKRNMKMLSKFPELKGIYKNVKRRCILDGEVVVLVNGIPDFYRLQKRTLLTDQFKIELEASRYPASFVAFDCIYEGNQELIWEPLLVRKAHLSRLVTEDSRLAVSRYIEEQGVPLYQAAEGRELEGVVAKEKNSIYYMGKRSNEWIKFKRMSDEEYVVAGYIQKGRHIFSLIIGKYRGEMLQYKGHVTSGVTSEVINMLKVTGINPFRMLPTEDKDAVWVELNRVCTVEYMPNLRNSLRQPVFKGFRDDIFPKEIKEK